MPRIVEGESKLGLKKTNKERRRAWASIDDALDEACAGIDHKKIENKKTHSEANLQGQNNIDFDKSHLNERDLATSGATQSPIVAIDEINLDDSGNARPFQPGFNPVETGFDNAVIHDSIGGKHQSSHDQNQKPHISQTQIREKMINPVKSDLINPVTSVAASNFTENETSPKEVYISSEINLTETPASKLQNPSNNPVKQPGYNLVKKNGVAKLNELLNHPSDHHIRKTQEKETRTKMASANPVATGLHNRVTNKPKMSYTESDSKMNIEPGYNPVQYQVEITNHYPVSNPVTRNYPQFQNQTDFLLERNLCSINGHCLTIFDFLVETLSRNGLNHVETSYPFLEQILQIPFESVRSSFKRLVRLNLLVNIPLAKGGRGAMRKIEISKEVMAAYMKVTILRREGRTLSNPVINRVRLADNTRFLPGSTPGESPSSSSSDFNNKNNTNTIGPESKRQELPEDWLQIQTPENVKAIGFGQTQIKQLFQLGTLSASEVQESLEAFAYDLEVGGISSRGSKLAFLMGILRRSGAYISEGLVNELKVQVENNEKRRREMADLEKRQAQDKLTAKAQEIASHMTEREKLSLVPENGLVKIGSVSHERLVMAKIVEGLSKS
jgi:hypothetical protein